MNGPRYIALLWLLIGNSPLTAQQQPIRRKSTAAIVGTVFDSVGGAALAGAVVQLIWVGNGAGDDTVPQPHTFGSVADSGGHFRLAAVPRGRYAIGFQHEAVRAFGLEAPIRGIELTNDDSVVVLDLAITATDVRNGHLCDSSSEGLLGGMVHDPVRKAYVPNAEVMATWNELSLVGGKLRVVPKHVTAMTSEDGRYQLCHVPSEEAFHVKVSASAYRSAEMDVSLSASGIARQDFALRDTSAVKGEYTLAGRVIDEAGNDVEEGTAVVAALGLQATVSKGGFVMFGLPAGEWSVDVRALGFGEQRVVAVTRFGRPSMPPIIMRRDAQLLDAVSVVGKANRESTIITEVKERGRVAAGTSFLPGSPWLQTAEHVSDVLRAARGFRVRSFDAVEARPYVNRRGRQTGCVNVASDSVRNDDFKTVAVYLNGERYPAGLGALNNAIPVGDVLAVEAYPDVVSAPFLWRTNDTCAVIAVWTKRR